MSIETFSTWLYATPFSTIIRDTTWAIPNIQVIHILAITIVIGSALVTELRLAGVLAEDQPVSSVLRRYLPWMRGALIALLVTGVLLIIAEPARTLGNTIFWIKMALVAGASLVTLRARQMLATRAAAAEAASNAGGSKSVAWLMIGIWCAVIFCGRFIAYT